MSSSRCLDHMSRDPQRFHWLSLREDSPAILLAFVRRMTATMGICMSGIAKLRCPIGNTDLDTARWKDVIYSVILREPQSNVWV